MVLTMAADDTAVEFLPADLAPGDARALELDRRDLDVSRVGFGHDPLFELAYEQLWNEFGHLQSMESREVIERRLAWHPATRIGDCWLRYELVLVRRQGRFVAVRDHTAVVKPKSGTPQAVVHLSHVLIDEQSRRTGLAGWLRAWPVQTARACLLAAGFPSPSLITLVAEMAHPDPQRPTSLTPLAAYEKAGFKKVAPDAASYVQPDFRPPGQIDASGGPRPLPFVLILRRVGREEELVIRGAELREIVESLYRMYGAGFREQDMAVVWESLRDYPGDDAEIPLVAPTR